MEDAGITQVWPWVIYALGRVWLDGKYCFWSGWEVLKASWKMEFVTQCHRCSWTSEIVQFLQKWLKNPSLKVKGKFKKISKFFESTTQQTKSNFGNKKQNSVEIWFVLQRKTNFKNYGSICAFFQFFPIPEISVEIG